MPTRRVPNVRYLGTMNWGLAADVATTIGVFVALAGVMVSVVFGIRAERAAASRSEAAARLSDDNSRRAVAALEDIAARGPSQPSPVPQRVTWQMTHQSGDTYLLQNVGDKDARGVEVAAAPDSNMIFREPDVVDLGQGEALTFVAAQSLATSDSTMTVTWNEDGDDERHQWRYPLPPRPPRRR